MTPDLQQEFQVLSEKARQHLKDVPESESYRHVFSLWTYPSFAPASRCTVHSPLPRAKGKQPFISFTTWRSDLDLEKLRSPVERLKYPKELAPTIQDDVLWLEESEVEEVEARIRDLSIPIYLGQTTVLGCDGTGFEFRYDKLFYGISLHWWEDQPSQWRAFTEAVVRVVKELEDRRTQKE